LDLDFDLHVHTCRSPCGLDEMLPGDIVRAAARQAIRKLGIADHFYPFTDPGIFDSVRAAFDEAVREIAHPPEVFFACEAEVMSPGRTAGSQEIADRLDYVIAGATHFQNTGITDPLPQGDAREVAEYVLRVTGYAAGLPWVDILAHPFFVVPRVCPVDFLEQISENDLLPVLEVAKANGVAMEISRRAVHTPEQEAFSRRFYPLCKRLGLKFTLGSDAHSLGSIGNARTLAPFIAEFGLTGKDFWMPESKPSYGTVANGV
jgi:histidinol phosphatase-like PHP family hydrolase